MTEIPRSPYGEALLEALPDGVVVTTPEGQILAVNQALCDMARRPREELVGSPIESLVPPRFRAEHVALRVGYIADGGGMRAMSARPDIVLVRSDGREVPVDVALSTVGSGPEHVVFASVRDASARRDADVVRERELRFLAAVNDITSALFSAGEVDETLRTITRQARTLLDADIAALVVPADDADYLRIRIADGYEAETFEDSLVPRLNSLAGDVMRELEPVLVADAMHDAHFYRAPNWPDDIGPLLMMPFHAGGEALGALLLASRRGRDLFRATDVTLMKSFAAHATMAILEARNAVQMRLADVLDDRDRVGTAMHDGVIKRISSAALTLHSVMKLELPDAARDRLWGVVEELDVAIALIRDAVFPR